MIGSPKLLRAYKGHNQNTGPHSGSRWDLRTCPLSWLPGSETLLRTPGPAFKNHRPSFSLSSLKQASAGLGRLSLVVYTLHDKTCKEKEPKQLSLSSSALRGKGASGMAQWVKPLTLKPECNLKPSWSKETDNLPSDFHTYAMTPPLKYLKFFGFKGTKKNLFG